MATYTAPAESSNGRGDPSAARLRPSDVMSVGTRVSWGSVLAGVVVALAVYITLNLLTFAIGISTIDQMASKTVAVWAAFVSTFCLLVALFLGGFVASNSTVGEEKTEAMTYGVLVWATVLLLLVGAGFSLGVGFFAGVREIGLAGTPVITAATAKPELGLTDTVSSQALAWWTFGGVVLSVLAAVGGALVGAGPELVLKRLRDKRVAVLARPA
jgi:hypothetical protein